MGKTTHLIRGHDNCAFSQDQGINRIPWDVNPAMPFPEQIFSDKWDFIAGDDGHPGGSRFLSRHPEPFHDGRGAVNISNGIEGGQ